MYKAIFGSSELHQMVIKSTQITTSWGITGNESRAGIEKSSYAFQMELYSSYAESIW
jgi:hypothetical protein